MTRTERIAWVVGSLALALLALAGGYWWGRPATVASAPTVAAPATPQVLYWYDPMVPAQHFDKPGKSPFMDMQLVPKYADAAPDTAGVRIDPQVRQNLGVRTALAKRGRLSATLRVPGTVGWNLREERVISLPVDAVVERLNVRTPFEPVRAGQVLMSVRAPAWSTALAEAQALQSVQSREAQALRSGSSGRLRALALPVGAKTDGRGAILLTAPVSGVVSEIAVREGQAVAASMPLLRLNGTDSMWVEAALPPTSSELQAGTPVMVFANGAAADGRSGRIEALLPQVDASTRTQRARIVLDNHDGQLTPGQFVQVSLEPEAASEAVLVPSEAIIADGTRSRVIVLRNERFVPVAVRTGRSGGGRTEVLSGLAGGESVVTSGQFLIDSEANLSGALDRLSAPADPHAQHPGKTP
jgi:Cu(I)/Ag(I) efflux system membrane fusion protein